MQEVEATFSAFLAVFIRKNAQIMEYKRQSRHPSDETRARISKSLSGQAKSAEHKSHLSQSLKAYWGNDNNFPADKQGESTIQDIML